jgi:hypothetical protein
MQCVHTAAYRSRLLSLCEDGTAVILWVCKARCLLTAGRASWMHLRGLHKEVAGVVMAGLVAAGVPIPAEHEAEGAEVERAIGAALRDADAAGVSGAAVRPRTMARLAGSSGQHLGRRLLHVFTRCDRLTTPLRDLQPVSGCSAVLQRPPPQSVWRCAQVTPFLLKRVTELTGGASLAANIVLIKHNAAIGAAIAVELARLAALPGGAAGAGPSH